MNAKKIEKIIYVVVGAVFMIGLVLAGLFGKGISPTPPPKTLDLPPRNDTVPAVPYLSDFGTKIVYTTDTMLNKEVYMRDCETRGGVFNVCGNTCARSAAACSLTCALTCEIK